MFDEFHFHEPLRCASGHEVPYVQTKDLANNMEHYHVFNGQVFVVARNDKLADVSLRIENGVLVRTQVEYLPPAKLQDGRIHVYTMCRECEPVYVEDSSSFLRDKLAEHHPWCSWELTVVDDRITAIDNSRVESREDVRQKLIKQGTVVLPDDDRAVQRALARWRLEHD